jgi:diguanylate cyclase (GGDEF)-like protein/PAS domain S-box-containing protein
LTAASSDGKTTAARLPPSMPEDPERRGTFAATSRASAEVPEEVEELNYRELVQSANTIVLRWDLHGRVTFLNHFGLEFFGFTADEILGRSVIGTIVPETDTSGRDLVQMIGDLLRHPDRFVDNENENMRRDGARVWVTWRNRVLHDVSGRTREILSIGIDTTACKRTEEALRDSESRYRALFESVPIALIERDASDLVAHLEKLRAAGVTDLEAHLRSPEAVAECLHLVRVTDMNAAAMDLLETRDKAELDAFPYVADAGAFSNLVRAIVADVAAGTLASQQREGVLRTLRGTRRNILVRTTVVPALAADVSPSGGGTAPATGSARILTAAIDITERKQAEEALRASEERFRYLAEHDNLTGLFNRRYLYQALEQMVVPERAPCSLIFMDLDHFKQIVDTYGHLNGSQVIQQVAQVIQARLAAPGFAVAYAGDEFVVVLPGSDKARARAVAVDVQTAVTDRVFLEGHEPPVRLTTSLGVATYPEDAADMEDLLAIADQALFAAKQGGRSAIAVAGEGGTPPRRSRH